MVSVPTLGRHEGVVAEAQLLGNGLTGCIVHATAHQVGGSAPALHLVAVVTDGKNHLFLSVGILAVILQEEVGIVRAQAVTHANHLLGCRAGIFPAGCAGIDLGIEVETGQQSLCTAFRGTRIGNLAYVGHGAVGVGQCFQLTLDPGKQRRTSYLRRQRTATDVLFGSKRRVAIQIHQHEIGIGAQETGLGNQSGQTVHLAACGTGKELVGTGNRDETTGVGGHQGGITAGCPRSRLGLGNVAVAPDTFHGVGTHLVQHHNLADKLALSGIVDIDVGLSRVILARQREGAVDVGQSPLKVLYVLVGRFAGLVCLVQRYGIQVAETGGHRERRRCDGQCIIYQFFHNAVS